MDGSESLPLVAWAAVADACEQSELGMMKEGGRYERLAASSTSHILELEW